MKYNKVDLKTTQVEILKMKYIIIYIRNTMICNIAN